MPNEPTPRLPLRRPSSDAAASPEPLGRLHPNKHRLTQLARTGTRKLFDARRRAIFIEWFAATCNVKLSAEKAGVAYQTVFKHRAADAGFAEAWDAALAQGYATLEAGLVAQAIGQSGTLAEGEEGEANPPAPGIGAEILSFEQRMALFREYRRGFGPGRRAVGGNGQRVADDAEIKAALIKRLKAFAVRRGVAAPPDGAELS